MVTTALRFLPPLAWSALIAWFSGPGWGAGVTASLVEPWLRALAPWALPEQIAGLHGLVRKAGHVVEYAVLARALLLQATRLLSELRGAADGRARHLSRRRGAAPGALAPVGLDAA